MDREQIYSALFTRVGNAAGFATKSRRMRHFASVAPADRPALFMNERAEQYARPADDAPATVTLDVMLYLCVDAGGDSGAAPASALNGLLDAVDAALASDAHTGRQTLGGLVWHCRVEGRITKTPGDMEGDGIAAVPVRILVTQP